MYGAKEAFDLIFSRAIFSFIFHSFAGDLLRRIQSEEVEST